MAQLVRFYPGADLASQPSPPIPLVPDLAKCRKLPLLGFAGGDAAHKTPSRHAELDKGRKKAYTC